MWLVVLVQVSLHSREGGNRGGNIVENDLLISSQKKKNSTTAVVQSLPHKMARHSVMSGEKNHLTPAFADFSSIATSITGEMTAL